MRRESFSVHEIKPFVNKFVSICLSTHDGNETAVMGKLCSYYDHGVDIEEGEEWREGYKFAVLTDVRGNLRILGFRIKIENGGDILPFDLNAVHVTDIHPLNEGDHIIDEDYTLSQLRALFKDYY